MPHRLVPILMYHSVSDEAHATDLPYTVQPAGFKTHVGALRARGANTLSVAQYATSLREKTTLPDRTMVITIDDGYQDTADLVMPALSEAGFVATVFVTTATVGQKVRDSRMISWSQIRDLHAAGFEIGSHSHNHIALDVVNLRRARDEMTRSRAILEDFLTAPVLTFAYPHGCYTGRLRQIAEDSGYLAACASKDRLSHSADDLYALARLAVLRTTDSAMLNAMVEGRANRPASSRIPIWRRAWRLLRKAGLIADVAPRE